MRFNIDNYKGRQAMHCKTIAEAKEFLNYLHRIGKRWVSGEPYTANSRYEHYGEDTVYYFNDGTYGDTIWAKEMHDVILEFSDFEWSKEFVKADLKTGDVILRRNGDVEIVNRELGMFICQSGGWNDLDSCNNDLTSSLDKDYDIIEIRRPKKKYECCFDAFVCKRGTLVYEREEPEEMTLEEVCALLGKKIKIIK